MRLQWKYILIINLAVWFILITFYVYHDIKAPQEFSESFVKGVESGAIQIAETRIRPSIEDEIRRWQKFNPNQIEGALRRLKEHLNDVVNIHVTLGDTRIYASLVPGKSKGKHIDLSKQDLLEIQQKGVKAKYLPLSNGKYAIAVIIPYREELLTQMDWVLLFNVGVAHQTDLENKVLSEGLRQAFESNGYELSEDAKVSIEAKDSEWRITDREQTYFVWKGEDQLSIVTDSIQLYPTIIEGYIQVLFDIPEIAIFIQKSRLLFLVSLIVVSVLLIFVIDMITNRLIMRPLESMMEIIKRAETNDLDSLPKSYSSGEIGRVTLSLVSMLRQLNESHSKRISALGQLAAGAAHDIRNPLNSIGMTAQHLKGIFSSPEEVSSEDIEEAKELLDIVNDEIKELKKITEQFLTLNRPKQLNLQPTDLNALLDKILSEFTLTMESAKVHVIRNYDKNLPAFQLDMGLIRQAIFNFVQNSIQAMSKGGSIYITTKMKQIDAGRQVDIEIRDTGVGIPKAIQEQIFDAYFTTKEKDGGMGLGLSISHQIITAHQGEVKLQSKVGMGTSFKISLPVKTD